MTALILKRLPPFVIASSMVLQVVACGRPVDGEILSGDAVRVLFSGKTVEGKHIIYKYKFRSYHDGDGWFLSYQNDSRQPRKARWWIDGDEVCIRWHDGDEDLCRYIVIDAAGHYRKMRKPFFGDWKTVVRYHSFTDGNPYDL